ncbi:hypothetical protein P7H22_21105 [Paenibacillus larvae]|nr:hypothetical protein [Paenibacillus larvae]MDT2242359.1 hypothetical protein [Paenibacillus larvae]
MICAAGKFGQYVGEIHIEFDPRDHTITGMDAGVVEIEGLQDDPDILHLLTKSRKEAQLALGVEVARLSSPSKMTGMPPPAREFTCRLSSQVYPYRTKPG